MIHDPYFRKGSGPWGVLLIHGIAGSPGHFRDLVPLIPEEYSVSNLLLAGHDGTPKDFGRASMAIWKAQAKDALEELLSRHEKVVIVGHSMGTLFALQAAIDHPDRVPALFLLNVPTRPRVSPRALLGALQVVFGKPRSVTAKAMEADTGIALTLRFWEYLGWLPRMAELLVECRRVRKLLPRLTVPTLAFHSARDELVSLRSRKDLSRPCIENLLLSGSGHFGYSEADTRLLQKRFLKILENLTTGKTGL